MTLSINNDGYAFLIRLHLMFSMSLWKQIQLLQIFNDLSIRHLIKLISCEKNIKFLKFKRRDFDYWYLKCIYQEKRWNA